MTTYAIITDLNRCTGCLACTVACKAINGVPVGNFWIKTLRIGPHPKEDGSGDYPDVEMYFLPVQCQHCYDPECVKVCPTEASHIDAPASVPTPDIAPCARRDACAARLVVQRVGRQTGKLRARPPASGHERGSGRKRLAKCSAKQAGQVLQAPDLRFCWSQRADSNR